MTPVPEEVGFTLEQVRSYPLPIEPVVAPTGARVAWVFVHYGVHNLWGAEGPEWKAFPITDYHEDEGQDLTCVRFTPDGERIIFVRGGDHHANFPAPDNLHPNPASSPNQPQMEILTVPFAALSSSKSEGEGGPKVIAQGDQPEAAPSGDRIAFLRDHQVWTAPLDGSEPAARLFFVRGKCSEIQWSPDGKTLAFVSERGDHSFIGLYRSNSEPIRYLAPSTFRDHCPRWSPDGKQIAFLRAPGDGGPPRRPFELYPDHWALWSADVETGEGRLLFQSPARLPGWHPRMQWNPFLQWGADDRLLFRGDFEGRPHLYSLSTVNDAPPLLLTPGDYMVEDVALSPDRKFLVYTANTGDDPDDVDRRHLWRTPVDAAKPEPLTSGAGLEYSPIVTGDGETILLLSADAHRPVLPAVLPSTGGRELLLAADQLPRDFPTDQMATPVPVTFRAADGMTVHCQRFEREEGAEQGTGKKPALVFIHGGPVRQMLLGWHNMEYYANAYAVNQYLAQCGYVVLSVNYRLGTGYGHAFSHPPHCGGAGAAEYQDIVAAGEYLRADPKVDPARIGVWGGSYGGYLTALALARNSDLFAAGVDLCGVHDWTVALKSLVAAYQTQADKSELEEALRTAWASSPVSSVSTWRSPVLLIHGDDDRNVEFHQTVDLAVRLREAGVPTEELIFPDDTHILRCYRNAIQANLALIRFFNRCFGMSVR